MNTEVKKKLFTRTLFRWHKANYRDMPWRDTRDAYRTLISEVMLQQTQVERVRTKYDVFLKKFPTVEALARASLGDVLRAWSGLGYNRRAKYLHECAKLVALNFEGKFPNDFLTLMTLPGIGRSTAAALMTFAYGEDEPMIDTNIRRILVRVFFAHKLSRSDLDKNEGATKLKGLLPSDTALFVFAKTLIPKGEGRMWNYAMLDVGASVCTARNHSDTCPLIPLHGEVGDFIYKKPQKKFAHSNRFYRGRILAVLANEGSVTLQKLAKKLSLPVEEVRVFVAKLSGEKMVVRNGLKLTLP